MKERIVSLALLAAVSIGVAPAFSQVSESAAGISNNDNLLADCMIQKRHSCKRVYKKCATRKKAKKVAAKPIEKVVRIETTKTIEKPVIIQQPAPEPQAVEQKIEQPAVVDTNQPVIIDRFEKRHRSLIHLGLFPFNLFGQ